MSNHTIGERIKSRRTGQGMTQDQLARSVGVTPQAVSKWEHDQSCPDISILPDLATVLDTSIDELLGKTMETEEKVESKKETNFTTTSNWNREDLGRKGSILFALYIFSIGALILANKIFHVDMAWWTPVWTVGLFFIGLYGLLSQFSLLSLTMSLAGAYLLLDKYALFSFSLEWSYVIPALILIWGIGLLVDILFIKKSFLVVKYTSKDGKEMENVCECNDGTLNCVLTLGEHRAVVATDLLRGGEITTGFGSFTVDFSSCTAVASDCVIDIDNHFGSLTLLIPKFFTVEIPESDSGSTTAATVEGNPDAESRGTVSLKLDNSFGRLVIRYIDS